MVTAYRDRGTQFCVLPFRNGIFYLHNGQTKQDESRNSLHWANGMAGVAWLSRAEEILCLLQPATDNFQYCWNCLPTSGCECARGRVRASESNLAARGRSRLSPEQGLVLLVLKGSKDRGNFSWLPRSHELLYLLFLYSLSSPFTLTSSFLSHFKMGILPRRTASLLTQFCRLYTFI